METPTQNTKPKRKTKSVSPTQRSLAYCRDRGWTVAIVEHWNPFARIRQDLFGCLDLLAVRSVSTGVLGVQTTSGTNVSARCQKIDANPVARMFLKAGNRIEVHGWRKIGPRGKAKRWVPRIIDALLVGDEIHWKETSA